MHFLRSLKDLISTWKLKPKMSAIAKYKLVIIGTENVGQITNQFGYIGRGWDPNIDQRKYISINGETCLLDILDTTGKKYEKAEYSTMQNIFLHKGDGFILVYNLNEKRSFEEFLELSTYQNKIKSIKNVEFVPMVMLGIVNENIQNHNNHIREIKHWSKGNKIPFIYTTAKPQLDVCGNILSSTFNNVDEAFHTLVKEIQKNHRKNKYFHKIKNIIRVHYKN